MSEVRITEGQLLWTPTPERVAASDMAGFMAWLEAGHRAQADDYDTLWRWSIECPEDFWAALWEFYGVRASRPYDRIMDVPDKDMVGTRWFPGAHLNYAEHILRANADRTATAIHHLTETRALASLSYGELFRQVRIVAQRLRALGVKPGDRVASYLPNLAETVVAMLATVAVGAVWAAAAPEFGVNTAVDRFSQIEPVLIFVPDGYAFGGKLFDRSEEVRQIAAALPSVRHVVTVSYIHPDAAFVPQVAPGVRVHAWCDVLAGPDVGSAEFRFEQVESSHPLWILFSSGTTGLPKAIVHGHGGVLLEHIKLLRLQFGARPESTWFFHTTAGWMMWNLLVASLLGGGSAVFYDGSPMWPGPDRLWKIAADTRATIFGASPTFVQLMEKTGLIPAQQFDLDALRMIVVSGAPCQPETFEWFYRAVKQDLWVTSQSGGTEIASGFVGCSPLLPVYAGEIQCRMLGMNVQSWSDAGEPLNDEVGELVVTAPFPSMPMYFWNDPGDQRYRETYFDVFPGVWRHGDFIRINQRGGCYIYGRSDATLNRYGVRIGSAEIYRIVEKIEGIRDSLIVCIELPDGNFYMPLFVQLHEGVALDAALRREIEGRLRREASPRHVPDSIDAVPAIPYTLTGKKMEVPVRKLLRGAPLEQVAKPDAMADPQALDWYVGFARSREPRA